MTDDKYHPLWDYVSNCGQFPLELSFDDIKNMLGFEIDHSFLNFKKNLNRYGLTVVKIYLKEKKVLFDKCDKKV